MKKNIIILSFILLFGFGAVAFGAWTDAFLSSQVGTSPSSGYILETDGTDSTWVDPISVIPLSDYLTLLSWYSTTTDGLAEGVDNLYWTQDRFDNAYNSTTTLNGLTIADYLAITNFSTYFDENYNATTTLNGLTNNQDNWNTAYDWGDHATIGYLLQSDWESTTTDALAEGSVNSYDKTVSLTEGSNIIITGTYPDYTIATLGGGVSGGIATTSPWIADEVVIVHNDASVESIATSSLGLPTFTDLDGYLTLVTYYATTTDGLSEGVENLYWTQTRFDDAYNATTTLNGFTPSDYLETSDFSTYFDIDYNATTTLNGLTISDYLAIADFSTYFDTNYNSTTTLNGFTDDSSDWNTSYSWGDHSDAGYLLQSDWEATTTTALAEGTNLYWTQDRWDTAYNATTTLNGFTDNSTNWNTAFGWGDWSGEGFITDLSTFDTGDLAEGTNKYYTQARVWDDVWASSTLDTILTNSQTSYLWGDHSLAGYYLSADYSDDWDSKYNATTTLNGFTDYSTNWNEAYNWGDHALAGYYAAANYNTDWDTKYNATTTLNGFTDSSSNWNTAYGWGDWSGEGFITDLSSFTTTNLAEGTNLYYTDARVNTLLNASTTIGAKSYSDLLGSPSDRITAGTNLSWSGDTLNASVSGGNPFNQWLDTTSTAQFSSLTLDTGITDVLKATAGVVSEVGSPIKNYTLLWNGTTAVWAEQGTSFTFSNASFTDNQTATQEIGTGTFLAIGATSFTATYNNGPATSGSVQIVSGTTAWTSALDMGSPYTGPTASTEAVSYPASPTAIRFRLTASDGTDTDTSDVTITLNNNRFWGVTSKTSGFTEADVEGLAGSELSNSKDKTFSNTAGAGEYILWASRKALGTVSFSVDGFSGGFQAPETVSITNASGYTEDFYVYRSTNLNLGTITVIAD